MEKSSPDLSVEDGTENTVCRKERQSDELYYLFDPYLIMPPLSGAPHAPLSTSDSRLTNQSVS